MFLWRTIGFRVFFIIDFSALSQYFNEPFEKTFNSLFIYELNKETSGLLEARFCVIGKPLLVESRIPFGSKNA